ncbi:unnamed protein product [Thelazia callipaeda]|uniref:POU domain protein n=1 Tax=Thelazia callipaeda TaxID=103827 RepID=A0A0N5CLP8_THECL|nr:unnamed protein product [Thelazia callipaeda]
MSRTTATTASVPSSSLPEVALFDHVTLQTAYIAAAAAATQLENHLQQQNAHFPIDLNCTENITNTTCTDSTVTIATTSEISPVVTTSTTPTTCFPSFIDKQRLYSLLSPQLQSYLQQQQRTLLPSSQQQQSNNGASALAHHLSAFSPINMTDLTGGTNSGICTQLHSTAGPSLSLPSQLQSPVVSHPQSQTTVSSSSQQSLDLLIMQMQMATATATAAAAAAAAGFLPTAFNVLPSTTALGLLAPHLRLLQLTDPNFAAYAAAATAAANMSLNTAAADPNISDTMTGKPGCTANTATIMEKSLLQTQMNLLAHGSISSSVINECASTSGTMSDKAVFNNDACSSAVSSQQLNPTALQIFALNNSTCGINSSSTSSSSSTISKHQQHSQLKRPYDEMSILRSLCNENYTAEQQEVGTLCRKRSRINGSEESEERNRQKSTKAHNSSTKNQHQLIKQPETQADAKPSLLQVAGSSKSLHKIPEKVDASDCLDENSPDRHHPFNHRPPAMEARFLECMAAIALHSNFSLPIKSEIKTPADNTDECEPSSNMNGSNTCKQNVEKLEIETSSSIVDVKCSSSLSSPTQLPSNDSNSANINNTTLSSEKKKCWPNSAIDEELCQKMENYKNTDVPVIHAFVLPTKNFSDPGGSAITNEKCSQDSRCTDLLNSVPIPVPVLNILLDRILLTMLD